VYYPWIHEACHWVEEDPRRHYYNASRLNEPVSIEIAWKATVQVATTQEATTTKTISKNSVQDKGKRNIVENPEVEKSCKMKVDPLLEKEILAVEEKREQRRKRPEQRKKEK